MGFISHLSLFLLLGKAVLTLPTATTTPLALEERTGASQYPFSRVVAFGDNLSDNGNGTYAHHVAAPNPNNTIYGYRTWTNGPVAISYLTSMMQVPLALDYAFGHLWGGTKVGATINVNYTFSLAPDGYQQISQYLSNNTASKNIADTLHFLWIGNNDINILHCGTDNATSPRNTAFAKYMAKQMVNLVQELIDAGAKYVFVPGLYAKNVAPIAEAYWYVHTQQQTANLGQAIEIANQHIAQALSQFGPNVIFYDTYTFMQGLWNNRFSYGITQNDTMCDGSGNEAWNLCMIQKQGNQFFWMEYVDPTTYVHKLIAQDMFRALNAHFGL